MKLLETEHEKKSFAITTVFMIILLLLCIFFGLTYLDPPPENGIAINFGNTEFGSGDNQASLETVQSSPQPTASAASTAADEDVTTQDVEDAPVITKSEKPSKAVTTTTVPKAKPVEAPKPSKNTTDALSSILNGPKSEGTSKSGEGPDDIPGNKGQLGGDPYANSYFGKGGGTGGGQGWGLNGRKLSGTGKVVQDCNQEGTVVIQITVNRSGNVIAAERSKGTTNSDPCLVNPALATARKYKWQPDADAPATQVGFIVVNFKLGE